MPALPSSPSGHRIFVLASTDGRHRYVIVVQAIDVEHVGQLGVEATSTPAFLGFSISNGCHLLGRAVLIPGAEVPAT